MHNKTQEKIIISLGGSLIVPEEIDTSFLNAFISLIVDFIPGRQFFLITGGGKVSRKYQHALKELRHTSDMELDWMGIHVTHLNARFIKMLFGSYADERIIVSEDTIIDSEKPIVVGGGWEPGSSTDLRMIQIAERLHITKVLNLSDVSYVYSEDPRENPNAKALKDMTWGEYRALVPREWDPGLSLPFDPIAACEAEKVSLEVVIMDGKNIKNLRNYLNNESFEGTVIHS